MSCGWMGRAVFEAGEEGGRWGLGPKILPKMARSDFPNGPKVRFFSRWSLWSCGGEVQDVPQGFF